MRLEAFERGGILPQLTDLGRFLQQGPPTSRLMRCTKRRRADRRRALPAYAHSAQNPALPTPMKKYDYRSSNAFVEVIEIPPYQSGPLDGLSFAVKDNIDLAQQRTSYGRNRGATHIRLRHITRCASSNYSRQGRAVSARPSPTSLPTASTARVTSTVRRSIRLRRIAFPADHPAVQLRPSHVAWSTSPWVPIAAGRSVFGPVLNFV